MNRFIELENQIDKEINAYLELNGYLDEKKQFLIKSDIKNLEIIDLKILELNKKLQEIFEERISVNKEFGDEKIILKQIIANVKDYNLHERLQSKYLKIKEIAKEIKRKNEINQILINHSLKIIEGTVKTIADTLNPIQVIENEYTKQGKLKVKQMQNVKSAIVKEA